MRESEIMSKRFLERGYSNKIIKEALTKTLRRKRETLLVPRKHEIDDTVRFITVYNEKSREMRQILQRHWAVLGNEPSLRGVINMHPTITYQKGKNFKDKLCNTLQPLNRAEGGLKGFFPCNKCKACRGCNKVQQYKNTLLGTMQQIEVFATCTTEYVVYVLSCPCELRYIGSTKLPVKKRILEHKRAINNFDTQYPVAGY